MTLNAKVLMQSLEGIYTSHGHEYGGPDFRAALVPDGTAGAEMRCIARYLGVTVIQCKEPAQLDAEIEARVSRYLAWGETEETARRYAEREVKQDWKPFTPELPVGGKHQWREVFADFCPTKRCAVPDYVPDVVAGASGPSQLSEWKIKAIKICIILERRGYLVTKDFNHIGIDRKRWHDMGWLASTETRGKFVAGSTPLDLRAAHPVNYGQIEADWQKWRPPERDADPVQGDLI